MKPDDLLSLFRSKATDIAQPYLWSDDEVFDFMDDAQKQFCRLTGGISDSTSSITQLSVSAGDEYVSIDPRILKVRYAKRLSDHRPLKLYNFEDLNQPSDLDDYGVRREFRLDDVPGPLQGLISGMERHKLRCLPIPDVAYDLALIVYRIPLESITPEDQPDLEIEEQHHQYLVYWMLKLAYEKLDAEAFDRGKADENEKKFLAYCQEAKHERELREHKYRTVAYGGY